MSRKHFFLAEERVFGENARQLKLEMPTDSKILDYQIEMIGNNQINGLIPFQFLKTDRKPCFYYDLSGVEPLTAYIQSRKMDIYSIVEILLETATIMTLLNKYLLEESCLLFDFEYVYINPKKKTVGLIYLPAESLDTKEDRFSHFILELIQSVGIEDSTGKLFCRKILEEIKKASFNYNDFCNFLLDILCFSNESIRSGQGQFENVLENEKGTDRIKQKKRLGVRKNDLQKSIARAGKGKRDGNKEQDGSKERSGNNERAESREWDGHKERDNNREREGNKERENGRLKKSKMSDNESESSAKRSIGRNPLSEENADDSEKKVLLIPAIIAAGITAVYFLIVYALHYYRLDQKNYNTAILLVAVGAELYMLKKYFPRNGLRFESEKIQNSFGHRKPKPQIEELREDSMKKMSDSQFRQSVDIIEQIYKDRFGEEAEPKSEEELPDKNINLWEASLSEITDEAPSQDESEAFTITKGDDEISNPELLYRKADVDAIGFVHQFKELRFEPQDKPRTKPKDERRTELSEAGSELFVNTRTERRIESGSFLAAGVKEGIDTAGILKWQKERKIAEAADALKVKDIMAGRIYGDLVHDDCEQGDFVQDDWNNDMKTELLTTIKKVDATLFLKEEMREYGIVLKYNGFIIGRQREKADLVLQNRAVGKTHARIERNKQKWCIKDMDSKNGTYINNIKLESGKDQELKNYDVITIANVDLIFILSAGV